MSNNKAPEFRATPAIVLIAIILAALKLDGAIDIPWVLVIAPIIVDVIFDFVVSLVAMLCFGIMEIRKSTKEDSCIKHYAYNSKPLYWDYKTKTMYDATTGRKIDHNYVTEEEQE